MTIDDNMKRRLDAAVRDALENTQRTFTARKAVMHMLSFGEREIRPGHVGCFRARSTARAFKINALGYATDWTPDPPRWWWRIWITAWILRTIFRRRRPYQSRTPFLVERFFGDEVPWDPRSDRPRASYASGPLDILGWDVKRGPVNAIFGSGMCSLVVQNNTGIEIWIRNTHPTRTAKLWIGLSGEALVE